MPKVSYRRELLDNGIELSVRHLKQYFKFGHGKNAFITKAVDDVSFDIISVVFSHQSRRYVDADDVFIAVMDVIYTVLDVIYIFHGVVYIF